MESDLAFVFFSALGVCFLRFIKKKDRQKSIADTIPRISREENKKKKGSVGPRA